MPPQTRSGPVAYTAGAEMSPLRDMPDPHQQTDPQNLDLERSVLGVVLSGQHTVAIQLVRQHVPHPLIFADRKHRLIWLACLELDDAGAHLNGPAVAELLSRMRLETALERLSQIRVLAESDLPECGTPEALRRLWTWQEGDCPTDAGATALVAVGGAQVLNAIADGAGSYSGLERNSLLLRDYFLKRQLLARLTAISDATRTTTATFSAMLAQTDQALLGLRRFDTTTLVHGLSDVISETLAEDIDRQCGPNEGVRSTSAGIAEQIMQLRPGGLYVLGARPGAGKTSFALRLVRGVVTAPEPIQHVLYISLEVGRCDLGRKLIADYGRLQFRDIDRGTLSTEMQDRMETSAKAIAAWPMDIVDSANLTVHEVRAIVRRRQTETAGQLKFVVVDYLQLLLPTNSAQSEYDRISEVIRILKIMARESGVSVLALSQMLPEVEDGDTPHEPRIADLHCSRAIEPEADAVLFLHRVDTNDEEGPGTYRTIKFMTAKNRFGYTGTSLMRFEPATMSFEPIAT